ncbi:MAG: threonine-phosphate decarboxylase [Candidatus Rokubacteria bacterium]|nr:threonine-phosphate decarboxylase [Candidatus Rokubacteria bacterium]
MRHAHGGDLRRLAMAAGVTPERLLDFSASINPLGLSPAVEAAITEALPAVIHYPDPEAAALREALASYHGLSPEQVLPANGSTELIYLLTRALAPGRSLILHPAFSEYEAALELAGARLEHELLDEDHGFVPELPRLLPRLAGQDLVVLANPNNPAGSLIPKPTLLALAEAAHEAGATLVVDEAFIDFVEEASLKKELAHFPRLVLLRSLTKCFALPGLRVGYALASAELVARLSRWKGPWSVNALAGAAGIAALADREYQERFRLLVPRWREEFQGGLQRFGQLRVFPAVANYLLARLLDPGLSAPVLKARLLRERIAIRDCTSFRGLGPAFIRLAVRRPEEQALLLEALERCL